MMRKITEDILICSKSAISAETLCSARWVFFLGLMLSILTTTLHAEDDFVAVFVNGERVSDRTINSWEKTEHQPTIKGKRLFDNNNPVRYWIQTALPSGRIPKTYIEFFGNDRLPCIVEQFVRGIDSPAGKIESHLIVKPTISFHRPNYARNRTLRVSTNQIRKIVWRSVADNTYEPGTLWYHDGRRVKFNRFRWGSFSAKILGDSGSQEVPLNQIAEIHFLNQDSWDVYFNQLTQLVINPKSRLVNLSLSSGAIVTGSTERFQVSAIRGKDTRYWYHLLQPVWALDPFWLKFSEIRIARYFSIHEVPLSFIEPADVQEQHLLGGPWHWQRNRSVQGEPIRSAKQEFGWGIGVHAQAKLEYSFHPLVRSFRTKVAIDQVSGPGGCAQAKVFLSSKPANTRYVTPIMVGSGIVHDAKSLALSEQEVKSNRLVLLVDPVTKNAPAGTDPLDIRDSVDWIDPMFVLDETATWKLIQSRQRESLFPLQDWELASGSPELIPRFYWDLSDPKNPKYELDFGCKQPITLTKTVSVQDDDHYLALSLHTEKDKTDETQLDIKINGTSIKQPHVPRKYNSRLPSPIFIPVDNFQGQKIQIEIAFNPKGGNSFVHYSAMEITKQPATLFEIFDEDLESIAKLEQGEITSTEEEAKDPNTLILGLETDAPYSADVALTLTENTQVVNPLMFDKPLKIRANPKIGEFRYLRFAWMKEAEGMLQFTLVPDGEIPKIGVKQLGYSYFAGQGHKEKDGLQVDYRKGKLEWTVISRDLFADFGEFDITGIRLKNVGKGEAAYDHFYLSRTNEDFALIKTKTMQGVRQLDRSDKERSKDSVNRKIASILKSASSHLKRIKKNGPGSSRSAERVREFLNVGLELAKDDPKLSKKIFDLLDQLPLE